MLRGENCTEMELQSSAGTEPQQWHTICTVDAQITEASQ